VAEPILAPSREIAAALRLLVARRPNHHPEVAFLTSDWDAELWVRGGIHSQLLAYCNNYDDSSRWPALLVCGEVETNRKTNVSTVYYVELRGDQPLVYQASVVNVKKTAVHRFSWKVPDPGAISEILHVFG
jgi:hypothetical protein